MGWRQCQRRTRSKNGGRSPSSYRVFAPTWN
uniref:Uncharacterized protein n=1 Tax=Myoviridae sp. ctshb19 TaxID=2825194 RepID=A0A8S5UGL6_9CAUD|nr:MAG TPA: hypothetical protein [Myoviridae sp. ctshb19]